MCEVSDAKYTVGAKGAPRKGERTMFKLIGSIVGVILVIVILNHWLGGNIVMSLLETLKDYLTHVIVFFTDLFKSAPPPQSLFK